MTVVICKLLLRNEHQFNYALIACIMIVTLILISIFRRECHKSERNTFVLGFYKVHELGKTMRILCSRGYSTLNYINHTQ